MSEEELEKYETEMELRLYREYRDVLPMFTHVVETERRFYLANDVKVIRPKDEDEGWIELVLTDAWVWDMHRPARFVSTVRVFTNHDVNIEELARKEEGLGGDGLGSRIGEEPLGGDPAGGPIP
ncbi:MAG: DUF2469 domain-containing protein [Actinomycetota bacterium]|nr:DUF2469 domain-containing protein [Actinomycetota bacterium]